MNVTRKFVVVITVSGLLGAVALDGAYAATTSSPSYQSSITVGDTGDGEHAEAARYMELAKIDAGKAMAAAQTRVPGKVLSAALDNENGNLVYSVVITPTAGGPAQDVKVDAGNGVVLHIDAGNSHEDRDEGDQD
jgi:uncharacterized membrane protein YkoI